MLSRLMKGWATSGMPRGWYAGVAASVAASTTAAIVGPEPAQQCIMAPCECEAHQAVAYLGLWEMAAAVAGHVVEKLHGVLVHMAACECAAGLSQASGWEVWRKVCYTHIPGSRWPQHLCRHPALLCATPTASRLGWPRCAPAIADAPSHASCSCAGKLPGLPLKERKQQHTPALASRP